MKKRRLESGARRRAGSRAVRDIRRHSRLRSEARAPERVPPDRATPAPPDVVAAPGDQRARELPSVSQDLPSTYNRTRLVLMDVDPRRVHAFWEVTDDDRTAAAGTPAGEACPWVLRFYDVTVSSASESTASPVVSHFDLPIDLVAGNWYVELWADAKSYYAEIGPRASNAGFTPVCRSNVIHTSRGAPSPRYEPRWMKVEGEFGDVQLVADETREPYRHLGSDRGDRTQDSSPAAFAAPAVPGVPAFPGAMAGPAAGLAQARFGGALGRDPSRPVFFFPDVPAPVATLISGPAGARGAARPGSAADPATFGPSADEVRARYRALVASLMPLEGAPGSRQAGERKAPSETTAPVAARPESHGGTVPVGSSDLSSGGLATQPGQASIDLELNAEVIVYGRAQPGQTLRVNGRWVAANPDGTFRVHWALPTSGGTDRP